MSNRKLWIIALSCVTTASLATASLMAAPPEKKTTTHEPKTHETKAPEPKTTTIEGKIVDIYCATTGHYASTDHAKCSADCIRAGVPAAIETTNGMIILGDGMKSASAKLATMAHEHAKITGKLYEKNGVKYFDIEKIEKVASAGKTHTNHAKATHTDATARADKTGRNAKIRH